MISINEIYRILPHKYPFLLIDRILEFEAGRHIAAIKNVTINEPFFQGHFPDFPIMPGVLIIEAMAQVGAILALKSTASDSDFKNKYMYFSGIDKAKFRKPVYPGDQIRFELEVMQSRPPYWRLKGNARVEEVLVCEAELKAMVGDKLSKQ
ncbi:MAG: 3-hydroxyacyl-ACP dehydratase FabZ [Nitrospirota bacterium]